MIERNDDGFSTAWILVLALLIFLTGAVFFQFGSVIVDREKLVSAADRAADAGATAVDEDVLLSSDGQIVKLSPESIERCAKVLDDEEAGDAGIMMNRENSTCELNAASDVMIVTVKGKVSMGVFSGWLGIPTKRFSIVSKARPSCSDSTDAEGSC